MRCPYCGRHSYMTREHFYPRYVYRSPWDFKCCESCNYIKNSFIVYPAKRLFRYEMSDELVSKFIHCYNVSDTYLRLTHLRSVDTLRSAFRGKLCMWWDKELKIQRRRV